MTREFSPHYHAAVAFSGGEILSPYGVDSYFVYFPLVIFYYLPLSHLSFHQAFLVITLRNLLLALVTAILATKILDYYNIRLPAYGKWLLFLAIIFFCPVTASLNSGNVNTLVACPKLHCICKYL